MDEITPGRIAAFTDAVGDRLDALLVQQGDRLLVEAYAWPHTAETLHTTHSATKSFTGVAAGFAIDQGALGLDDRVVDFFPDHAPATPSENLARMTVRDVLTMRTGHLVTPSGAEWRLLESSWVAEFLAMEVGRAPGEEFSYSSASAHILSAIVQRAVGETVPDYLRPRLFEPLGITDWVWELDPEGVASGGNGLSLRARDFLKWGLVHRDGGRFEGRQIVPEWWIRESTHPQVTPIALPAFDGKKYRPGTTPDPTRRGYGYQIWCGPQDAFYASGLFGQLCVVVPSRDLVVLTNAAAASGMLPAIFDILLATEPIPDREPAPWASTEPPAVATTVRPLAAHRWTCDPNEEGLIAFALEERGDTLVLTTDDARGRHELIAGIGGWHRGRTGLTTTLLHHSYQEEEALVEASARWVDGEVLEIICAFVESPFRDTIRLRFADGDASVEWRHRVNVNSGPTELPPVTASGA